MSFTFQNLLKNRTLNVVIAESSAQDRIGVHSLAPNEKIEIALGERGAVLGFLRAQHGIAFGHTDQRAWFKTERDTTFSVAGLVPSPGRGERAIRNEIRRGHKGGVFEGLAVSFSPVKEKK